MIRQISKPIIATVRSNHGHNFTTDKQTPEKSETENREKRSRVGLDTDGKSRPRL